MVDQYFDRHTSLVVRRPRLFKAVPIPVQVQRFRNRLTANAPAKRPHRTKIRRSLALKLSSKFGFGFTFENTWVILDAEDILRCEADGRVLDIPSQPD